jgi:hypothetical protein
MGKTTPDWAMADINGTWNNIKSGAGHVADWAISGMANSPVGQAVQRMLPANSGLHETIANANAVTKADVTGMLNAGKEYLKTLASGDLVAWGGAAFDIGSMFIGVGEANIAAKGAALAGKFAKMAEGAASVTKVGAALAKDTLKGMVREAPERMAKFGGDLRTALAHVTGETQAKTMLENMRNVFQRGFGAETDLAFAGGADVLRGTEFAANGAEDVARVARTSVDDALPKGVNREFKSESGVPNVPEKEIKFLDKSEKYADNPDLLKDYHEQLQMQEDGINNMTVKEWIENRQNFKENGRDVSTERPAIKDAKLKAR